MHYGSRASANTFAIFSWVWNQFSLFPWLDQLIARFVFMACIWKGPNGKLTSDMIAGLSRDLYRKVYYEQQSARQLPVRWMALETLTLGLCKSTHMFYTQGPRPVPPHAPIVSSFIAFKMSNFLYLDVARHSMLGVGLVSSAMLSSTSLSERTGLCLWHIP